MARLLLLRHLFALAERLGLGLNDIGDLMHADLSSVRLCGLTFVRLENYTLPPNNS